MENEHSKRKIPTWLICLGVAILISCLWAVSGKKQQSSVVATADSTLTAEAAEENFMINFMAAGEQSETEIVSDEDRELKEADVQEDNFSEEEPVLSETLVEEEEAKEVMPDYVGGGGEAMEAALEITEIEVSPFTVSKENQSIPVTVTIQTENTKTPDSDLFYAFLPEGIEPKEEDWNKQNVLEVEIHQNGQWIAYCKDEEGNLASVSHTIIAVDQKLPVLTVRLEEENWCSSTQILAQAEDATSLSYRFTCESTGEDSGWMEEASYPISENGLWQVEAKDAAGNISVLELTVTNIDRTPPVIHSIKTKERE